jgi:nucleoid DNA-binding protein
MKSSIIAQIQEDHPGYTTKVEAERALQTVTAAILKVVHRDGEARVPGFGTFKKKHREGRMARNPRTGEQIQVLAKDVIAFKPSTGA